MSSALKQCVIFCLNVDRLFKCVPRGRLFSVAKQMRMNDDVMEMHKSEACKTVQILIQQESDLDVYMITVRNIAIQKRQDVCFFIIIKSSCVH